MPWADNQAAGGKVFSDKNLQLGFLIGRPIGTELGQLGKADGQTDRLFIKTNLGRVEQVNTIGRQQKIAEVQVALNDALDMQMSQLGCHHGQKLDFCLLVGRMGIEFKDVLGVWDISGYDDAEAFLGPAVNQRFRAEYLKGCNFLQCSPFPHGMTACGEPLAEYLDNNRLVLPESRINPPRAGDFANEPALAADKA